jgi:hypothetical protein
MGKGEYGNNILLSNHLENHPFALFSHIEIVLLLRYLYHVAASRLPRKSHVTVSTMTANVAEQVSQQPGPMANAKAVTSPISGNATKKRHWLSA